MFRSLRPTRLLSRRTRLSANRHASRLGNGDDRLGVRPLPLKSPRLLVLALAGLSLAANPAAAAVCQRWSAPQKLAAIDPKIINEASGIGISRLYPGRL